MNYPGINSLKKQVERGSTELNMIGFRRVMTHAYTYRVLSLLTSPTPSPVNRRGGAVQQESGRDRDVSDRKGGLYITVCLRPFAPMKASDDTYAAYQTSRNHHKTPQHMLNTMQ